MEHHNIDHEIRKKLEYRKITPSNTAWSTLENRLNTPCQSRRKHMLRYGVAAAIVVLIISGFYTLNAVREKTIIPVVDVHKVPELLPFRASSVAPDTIPLSDRNAIQEAPAGRKDTKIIPKQGVTTSIATSEKKIYNSIKEKAFKNQNPDKAIADIDQIPQWQDVTDTEIILLLEQAEKEIRAMQGREEFTKKIDAIALLESVETAPDQSLRDKVFEALKEGFYKAKTAVAERNH